MRSGPIDDTQMDLMKEIREMSMERYSEVSVVRKEFSKQGKIFNSAMKKFDCVIEKFYNMWLDSENLEQDVADPKPQAY